MFVFYVVAVAFAEVLTTFMDPGLGLVLHGFILVSLLALSAWKHGENPSVSLYLSLSLAPLIRIVSLSLPLAYFPRYAWYLVAGAAIFLAVLMVMRVMEVRFGDVGVNLENPIVQLAVGVFGLPLGVVEYYILRPEPLVVGLGVFELLLLALALIFFTGFVEELVFRGVLQRAAVASFGRAGGVLGVGVLFACMHIGWLSLADFIFVLAIGLFFGLVVAETRSLLGVSLAHGLTNVVLFLVLPSVNFISVY